MSVTEQHRLAVELAVWIADQVRRFGAFSATPRGRVLDSATSPLSSACYALWSVGVAVTTGPDGGPPEERGYGTPPPHFRLLEEREVRQQLAGREVRPKELSRLIRELVAMKEYVPEAFELTGDWFRPALPQPLHDAFVAAGFLECTGGRCRWTNLMAQWVEWSSPNHLWESPAESEARHLAEYGPIWKTMPPWIRVKVIPGGELNRLMLVDAIRRFWDGEWKSGLIADWEDPKRLVDAMEIGDQIERLVKAGRLSRYRLYPFARLFSRLRRR